jgi:hypothetical protein
MAIVTGSSTLFDAWKNLQQSTQKLDPTRIDHDGEGDDLMAMSLISKVESPLEHKIEVFPSYGKQEILYKRESDYQGISSNDKAQQERAERVNVTSHIFKNCLAEVIVRSGALSNEDTLEDYVESIRLSPPENRGLILHTASFKPLQKLFQVVEPNQLHNKIIIAYGSINLAWATQSKEEGYRAFYDSLKRSGAKLVLIEGFPFLGERNKITEENTPITYKALQDLNGPAGEKFLEINARAAESVRLSQVKKIAAFVCEAYEKDESKKAGLISKLVGLLRACGSSIEEAEIEKNLADPKTASDMFVQIMDKSFMGGQIYNTMKKALGELKNSLVDILGEETKLTLSRPINIYGGTSYQNQALIADQLPAIVLKELLEGKEEIGNISSECYPVEFAGLKGNFPQYKESENSPLFYLDLRSNIKRQYPGLSEEEVTDQFNKKVDFYLNHIDCTMARSLVDNQSMMQIWKRNWIIGN